MTTLKFFLASSLSLFSLEDLEHGLLGFVTEDNGDFVELGCVLALGLDVVGFETGEKLLLASDTALEVLHQLKPLGLGLGHVLEVGADLLQPLF